MTDRRRPAEPELEPSGIRLQKVLATAGVGSRRHNEELIAAGRVRVDGRVVTEQGMRVDPEAAVIEVDGERVVTQAGLVHLALNKPLGVLSAMSDDRGRPTVADLVGIGGVFHVGRLDADSEGLLLMTNDGTLGHRLSHPSFEIPKTYLIEVTGRPTRATLARLRAGVTLEDGPVSVDELRVVGDSGPRAMLEITLHEGRNRIVRRLMDSVDHPVRRLVRTRIGSVNLGSLRAGLTRPLTRPEIAALYRAVEL
jgi:23S rRNA pseudouridine2605 synthase